MSVTVAVQMEFCSTTTGFSQESFVVVLRGFTMILKGEGVELPP